MNTWPLTSADPLQERQAPKWNGNSQTLASDHGTDRPGAGRTAFFLLSGPEPRLARGTCVL
jgi:hypothetical protein